MDNNPPGIDVGSGNHVEFDVKGVLSGWWGVLEASEKDDDVVRSGRGFHWIRPGQSNRRGINWTGTKIRAGSFASATRKCLKENGRGVGTRAASQQMGG